MELLSETFTDSKRICASVWQVMSEDGSGAVQHLEYLTKIGIIYNIVSLRADSSSSSGPAQCDTVNRVRWGTKQH